MTVDGLGNIGVGKWKTRNKSVAKSVDSGIIKLKNTKSATINSIYSPVESTIEQRNSGKGNPNAVLQYGVSLNKRQQNLLSCLSDFDSQITVPKKTVSMTDLSALTAETGDEFAMFTKGNERLIIRGNKTMVNVDIKKAKQLANARYRWSGHTHSGINENCMISSSGDHAILGCFKQKISAIYNSKGQYRIFEKED